MTTKLRHVFYLAVIVTLFLANPARAEATAKLSAKEILDKVAKTYAGVSTYVDEGVVDMAYYEIKTNKETSRNLRPFKTFFDRDKLFKFEFAGLIGFGPRNRNLIFSDFKKTKTSWEQNGRKTSDQDLKFALAGAEGLSGGSSSLIPIMLLSLSWTCGVSDMDLTELYGIEKVSGQTCFKITGKKCKRGDTTLWIDSKTFLVHKIEEIWIQDKKSEDENKKMWADMLKKPEFLKGLDKESLETFKKLASSDNSFEEYWTKTVTTYDPKIGVTIDPKKVVFDPK